MVNDKKFIFIDDLTPRSVSAPKLKGELLTGLLYILYVYIIPGECAREVSLPTRVSTRLITDPRRVNPVAYKAAYSGRTDGFAPTD